MPWLRNSPPGCSSAWTVRDVVVELAAADVLVHADAGDLVERPVAELAVVQHADLDPVGQARRPRTRSRASAACALGERHADAAHAVVLGGVDQQRAPAAADVEQPLAGLRAAACGRSARACAPARPRATRRVGEVRARVDHARAEQQLVEAVGDVVVVLDRGPVAEQRVQAARAVRASDAGDRRAARASRSGERAARRRAARAVARRECAASKWPRRRAPPRGRRRCTSIAPLTHARARPIWPGACSRWRSRRRAHPTTGSPSFGQHAAVPEGQRDGEGAQAALGDRAEGPLGARGGAAERTPHTPGALRHRRGRRHRPGKLLGRRHRRLL